MSIHETKTEKNGEKKERKEKRKKPKGKNNEKDEELMERKGGEMMIERVEKDMDRIKLKENRTWTELN